MARTVSATADARMVVTMTTELGAVEFTATGFGPDLKLVVPYSEMRLTREEARAFLENLTKVVAPLEGE